MLKEKTKDYLEKVKARWRRLNFFFSILSVLAMLAYPVYALYTKKGNLYVNIGVFVVSLVYGFFWIKFGSKKAYKINRVYKWSKLLLKLVSILINAYSIYVTATNFNITAAIMTGLMFSFWLMNFIFNILYDVASAKVSKFIETKKQELQNMKNKQIEIEE